MALTHSQNLDLSLKQQLTLTPQLQQAIKILNMNTMDLNLEVTQMLSQNFMLETDSDFEQEFTSLEDSETVEEGIKEDIDAELDYDSTWDEHYDQDWREQTPYREEAPNLEEYISDKPTLDSFLKEQLDSSAIPDDVREAAETFIYHLDEDGYLREKISDLARMYDFPLPTAKAGVEAIKNCQPSGVGASDLQECLALQMEMLPKDTPYLDVLERIMSRHFLFINKNPAMIRARLGVDEATYNHAIALLRSLNPRPAREYNAGATQYVKPEIIVRESGGISYVETGENLRPALSINETYANMIKHANAHDKALLQAQLNEARWFINAIDKRADTIKRVAGIIVALQQDFFQEGEKAMQSLTRQKVADMLDIHESTVSRAVNGKYLMCKRGIFELRYFFSNQLSTENGEDQSTTAVKAIISEMVGKEDAKKPLSDQKITDLLSDKGYKIARRTVAKYREELDIPTSSIRRHR